MLLPSRTFTRHSGRSVASAGAPTRSTNAKNSRAPARLGVRVAVPGSGILRGVGRPACPARAPVEPNFASRCLDTAQHRRALGRVPDLDPDVAVQVPREAVQRIA